MAKNFIMTIELAAAVIAYGQFCWHLANRIVKFVKCHFHKQK